MIPIVGKYYNITIGDRDELIEGLFMVTSIEKIPRYIFLLDKKIKTGHGSPWREIYIDDDYDEDYSNIKAFIRKNNISIEDEQRILWLQTTEVFSSCDQLENIVCELEKEIYNN